MTYTLLHFYLTILFIPVLLIQNCTSSRIKNNVSVKHWILTSPENSTIEIINAFRPLLRNKFNERSKIAIDKIEIIPDFNVNSDDYTVFFSSLKMDAVPRDNYGYSTYDQSDYYNEFKCTEHLQVNISKFMSRFKITGNVDVSTSNSTFRTNKQFSILLENVLISNIHYLQIKKNEISTINESGETNVHYDRITPVVEANEKDAPKILASIPQLITHVKHFYHLSIDKTVYENIKQNLPTLGEFQCASSGIGTYTTLSDKMYIMTDHRKETSETHAVEVGPFVVIGFSNITEITSQYVWRWPASNYQHTIININPLYLKSDWSITSSRGKEFFGTDSFKVNNLRIISSFDSNSYRSTKVELETSSYEWPIESTDEILCSNLDKLISNYIENSFQPFMY